MDIWAWVTAAVEQLREAGHDRLADLIDELPNAVCDDEHARVDGLVPEAVALARELDLPWVELFLRHWHLQSRVLHRLEVRQAQREAVALLEFSSRERTRECPQAICAVQDFAACHGLVDGQGYARERIDVCRETLARIDARWPCFVCVSGELADALVDAGDAAGAIDLVRAQRAAIRAAGLRLDDQLVGNEVGALLELGRADEALVAVERVMRRPTFDDHTRNGRKLLHAHALVELGRVEEARRALPPLEIVRATASHWQRWAQVVEALVDLGAHENDDALGRTLQEMLDRLIEQGVLRGAIEVGRIHARLAAARGDATLAAAAVDAVAAVVPELRAPGDAPDIVATLRATIAHATP